MLAVIVTMAAIPYAAQAQVAIEDRTIQGSNRNGSRVSNAAANNVAELHYQLQVLQQEVQQLRGMLEEQGNELRKLKQQRLDDYVELDRRLSSRANSPAPPPVSSPRAPDNTRSTTRAPRTSSPNELQEYRSAIDLVLKQRNYDRAVVELNDYLQKFPRGQYAPNAQYWLGEIYLVKKELDLSRQWFSRLLSEFSSHAKVPGAKYKLGTVYDQLGDKAAARVLLQEVAESRSDASELARKYLAENFSQ